LWQLAGDRNRGHGGLDRRLVRPVVGIETMEALDQSVAVFRRAGPAANPLLQFEIPRAQASGVPRADRPAEQRFVLDDDPRCRFDRRTGALRLRPPPMALVRRSRRPIADLDARQPWLSQQCRPVERQVGMGVLEGFGHFRFERTPPHFQGGRRSEQIEDTGP
jgi:hypothetical protein